MAQEPTRDTPAAERAAFIATKYSRMRWAEPEFKRARLEAIQAGLAAGGGGGGGGGAPKKRAAAGGGGGGGKSKKKRAGAGAAGGRQPERRPMPSLSSEG